jgi:hypothetical protein
LVPRRAAQDVRHHAAGEQKLAQRGGARSGLLARAPHGRTPTTCAQNSNA